MGNLERTSAAARAIQSELEDVEGLLAEALSANEDFDKRASRLSLAVALIDIQKKAGEAIDTLLSYQFQG